MGTQSSELCGRDAVRGTIGMDKWRLGGGDRAQAWLARISIALLVVGAALRLWQFAFNRSLWLDEAYLAASLANKDLWSLLSGPLDNGQAAPLGFLLLSKLSFEWLGRSDWSLRFVPLWAGLSTLVVAWRVSLQAWQSAGARVLFVGLVSFSPVLIYYSSEFKQYGVDVLVTLLIVWSFFAFEKAHLTRSCIRLAVVGVLGVWFSHPSVFVLAAAGSLLGLDALLKRRWRALAGLMLVGLAWALSFGVHYGLGIRAMAANPALKTFWLMAYAPLPPFENGQLQWYWENGLGLAYLAFRQVGIAHHLAMPAWTGDTTVFLGGAVVAGWLLAWRGGWRTAALLTLPVVITLLASALHLYPFRSRLILFLVPLIWMAVATAVEQGLLVGKSLRGPEASALRSRLGWAANALVTAVAMALLLVVVRLTWDKAQVPHNQSDIKSAMVYVSAHRQPGDHLMIGSWSHKAFAFYQDAFDLEDLPVYVFHRTKNAAHDAHTTVRRLCLAGEQGNTWLIVAHRFDRRHALLDEVSKLAPIDLQWEGEGAGVYRVNFARSAYCQRYRP